jgi:hypothetical protein
MKTVIKTSLGVLLLVTSLLLVACVPPAPPPVHPEPLPPAPEKAPTDIIKDLAYIEGSGGGYTDDADPQYEGVEIRFLWYDTKSELITFRNIPISVEMELYPRGFDFETNKYTLGKCIYKGEAQIDSSLSQIRILFEDIEATAITDPVQSIGKMLSVAKVTIHTPQQGDYSIEFVVAQSFELD